MYSPAFYHIQLLFDTGGGSCKLLLKHLHHIEANSTRNVTLLGIFTGMKDDREGLQLAFGPLWQQMDDLNTKGVLQLSQMMPLKAMETMLHQNLVQCKCPHPNASLYDLHFENKKSAYWEEKASRRPLGYKRPPRKNRPQGYRRPGYQNARKRKKQQRKRELHAEQDVKHSGAFIVMTGGTDKNFYKTLEHEINTKADTKAAAAARRKDEEDKAEKRKVSTQKKEDEKELKEQMEQDCSKVIMNTACCDCTLLYVSL